MRGDTLPKQQTCLNNPVERRAEFRLCLARYRSYQRMRELSPNHRSDLRHLLGRPEPIQARHQGGVQSRRDRKSRRRNGRSRTLSRASAFRFQYHLRHLFNEQGNAVAALDDLLPNVRRYWLAVSDAVDHCVHFAPRQPIKGESGHVRLSNPRWNELWPECYEQEARAA